MTTRWMGEAAVIATLMGSFVLAACGGAAETTTPDSQEPEHVETANTSAEKREGAYVPIQSGGDDVPLGRDTPGPSGERPSGNGFERPPE